MSSNWAWCRFEGAYWTIVALRAGIASIGIVVYGPSLACSTGANIARQTVEALCGVVL